jgi:methylmalonyl-CoA mutase N-terminal domain/subunit
MLRKEELKDMEMLKKEWEKACHEEFAEGNGEGPTNASGIKLKPVYTPLDVEGIPFKDIGLPGVYPYTRGATPLGYRALPWMMRIGFGYGTGKDTKERWEYLKKAGMFLHVGREEGEDKFPKFNVLMDLPHQRGYDADDIAARGRVGDCGLSVSTIEDLDLLFRDLPLDKLNVTFITFDPTLTLTAMYIVYARQRGYDISQLRMQTPHILYGQWNWDTIAFPPESALKLMVENINFRIRNMPLALHTSLSGYNMVQCGATPVQELAFTIAVAMAIIDECCKAGLDPNEVASRFWYHANLGMDIFEEVSKIRAWRRLWAKTMKERYGCTEPRALSIFIHSMTGGLNCTAQEPLNNIIRLTLLTLTGVLAGTDGIWTASYDEPLAIPSEEAAHLAVRTQQILFHETNIPSVADTLGGSCYVESLTEEIEKRALDLIGRIEGLGGAFKCWETGWFRKELARSASEWQEKLNSGEKVLVGVNKYRLEKETQKVNVFKHDPKSEQDSVDRVKHFKADRDYRKVEEALRHLGDAVEKFLADWPASCGTLMPFIIKAVEANATHGEIQGVLRKELGYNYTY